MAINDGYTIAAYKMIIEKSIYNQAMLNVILDMLAEEKANRTGKSKTDIMEEAVYKVSQQSEVMLNSLPIRL